MSTDGTQPPSYAPKGPSAGARPNVRPPRSGGRTATETAPEGTSPEGVEPATPVGTDGPAGAERSSATTAPEVPAEGHEEEGTAGPSVTERLKRMAHATAETARGILPSTGSRQDAVGLDEDDDLGTEMPQLGRADTAAGRPATRPTGATAVDSTVAGPRRVRLAVARVDPWSVMKLAFLLSVAIGIMIVVAAAVVWTTLDSLHVFTSVNETIAEITGSTTFFDLTEYLAFDRVLALATLIAVVDVVLLTALGTIGAFLYNIVAALVGGLHVTLTDD